MSASREKKNRQDLTQQEGYVDFKAQRAAEEQRAQKKSNALYITIAIIFVVVGIILGLMKSGIFQKNATALTVNGKDFTPAQVNYFYRATYNDIANSQYASYMGLDTKTSLSKQTVNDMAKMMLGISSEEEMTWDECLKNIAKENLTQIYCLYQQAVENGYSVDDTIQEQLDQNKASLNQYASSNGYSAKEYLKMAYGSNMTESVFDELMSMILVAEAYQTDFADSLTYTDAELESYYQSDKDCFDFADFEYIFFNGTGNSTTDADGNTVEPTEAERTAAAKAAKAAADDAVVRYAAGESLADIAADYSAFASYHHSAETSNTGSEILSWIFEDARVAGDTTVIEDNGSQYFMLFHGMSRPEYYKANVRHILFNADTSALDPDSATYDADVEVAWAAARAKAQDALAKWQAGAATADSFAELANELSEDPGSNTTGGLYADIVKSSNYVDSFKDWCFEDGRQVGDSGIVESTYGCHVMYLDSFSDTLYWKELVQNELMNKDYNEWLAVATANAVAQEGRGMKYVG